MAEITITGALVYKGVAEEIISNKNGKKYTKGTFVLECQEKYTSRVSFDAFDSMYTQMQSIKPNSYITIIGDLNSREYNGKWYLSLVAKNVYPATMQPMYQPQLGQVGTFIQQQPYMMPQQPQQQPQPNYPNQAMPYNGAVQDPKLQQAKQILQQNGFEEDDKVPF